MPSNTELRQQLYTFMTNGWPSRSNWAEGAHGVHGADVAKRNALAEKVAALIAGVFEGHEVTPKQVEDTKVALGKQLQGRTREDFAAAFGWKEKTLGGYAYAKAEGGTTTIKRRYRGKYGKT